MDANKKYNWHKIAHSVAEIDFSVNGMAVLETGGRKVCLVLQDNKIAACAHKCPHAGGQLSEGYIDALGNIVCPLHRYKFSLQNGRNVSGEGYYLKTYPVQVKEDGVYIGFAESNPFGWLK